MNAGDSAKTNLLGLARPELQALLGEWGERGFRAGQLMKWLHQRGVREPQAMTDLAKPLRARIEACADTAVPEIVAERRSRDGTVKWLLRLDDGNAIETVFIPEEDRGTLCVSSQVGCALDCTFCATARQGFNRNLSAAEIVAQLWVAKRALEPEPARERVITNVVLMGMGEPLMNFDNVVAAMRVMLDDFGYGLSKRRVTLSTSGLVPALERLTDTLDVALAVSLHAANDPLRDQLVPLNRKYPLAELLGACRRYVGAQNHKARVTFEYVMLDGVNDELKHARELVAAVRDIPAKVNLIPFNPFAGTRYRCSTPQAIARFRDHLLEAGLVTITRRTRGDDIDAACGQLAGQVRDRSHRERHFVRLEARLQRAREAIAG